MLKKLIYSLPLLITSCALASISLDAVKMNVIKTADNGVVNQDTIFTFVQKDDVVSAEYAGDRKDIL